MRLLDKGARFVAPLVVSRRVVLRPDAKHRMRGEVFPSHPPIRVPSRTGAEVAALLYSGPVVGLERLPLLLNPPYGFTAYALIRNRCSIKKDDDAASYHDAANGAHQAGWWPPPPIDEPPT